MKREDLVIYKRHGEAYAFKPDDKTRHLYIEAAKWVAKLTDEEIRCLRKYTKNSLEEDDLKHKDKFFYRLNRYLRSKKTGQAEEDKSLEYYSKQISKAIAKFKLSKETTCYRSDNIDVFKGYCKGDIYDPGCFLSTSISAKTTLKGRYKSIIFTRKNTKCAFIGTISRHKKQKELLFDKSVRYKVVLRNKNKTYLEVAE